MNQVIKNLLIDNTGDYILPFFWQRNEEETVIRDYMRKINDCGIKQVCLESRPHPDFCGAKWWEDMDVILDEARRRGMQVWILDDSHFPTGFANGAVKTAPDALCRQSILGNSQVLDGEGQVIEGLYGVGELVAGNAFTRQYPGAGVGISWAANTGRYAAEWIAESIGE